jgi:hypothetical protein
MGIKPMEEVYTAESFDDMIVLRMIIVVEIPLPRAIDEVANLEMFTFNRKGKQIVIKTHK